MTTQDWKSRRSKQKLPSQHYWEKTEITDKELWSSAFNAVASAANSSSKDIAVSWANTALKEWKKIEKELNL
jgi:hypothetical protein